MKSRFRAAVLAVALVGLALPAIAAEFGLAADLRTGAPVSSAVIDSSGVDVESSERLVAQRSALVDEASTRGVPLDHAQVSGAVIDDPAVDGGVLYLTWTEPMRPLRITRVSVEGAAQSSEGLSIQFDVPADTGAGAVCAIVEFQISQTQDGFHRLWHCSDRQAHGTRVGVTAAANLELGNSGDASVRVDEFALSSVPDSVTAEVVSIDQRWVTPGLAGSGVNPRRLSGCEEYRPGNMQLDLDFPHTPSPGDVFMTVPNGWCGNTAVRQGDPAGWVARLGAPVWDPRPSWNGVGAVYDVANGAREALSWTESTTVLVSECGLPGGFGCEAETDTMLAHLRT